MRLVVKMSFVMLMLIVVAAGCGGGGDDVSPSTTPTTPTTPTESETPQAGSNALYTVSVVNGSAGAAAVSVGSEAITVQGQTVQLDSAARVGSQPGHYRAFDTPGATSGPALDVHISGVSGYDYVRFGSWATGTVSPNPGFTIENYGAFLSLQAGASLSPVSSMPTTGSLIYEGYYAGYVDKESVGVSQVMGTMAVSAFFGPGGHGDGSIIAILSPPDPDRSSFAVPGDYTDTVQFNGIIKGNSFETDVTATQTVGGVTLPRGDTISIYAIAGCSPCLYSQGAATSGTVQGGFFGSNAQEAGGVYQFTIGRTRAVGAFGSKLQ